MMETPSQHEGILDRLIWGPICQPLEAHIRGGDRPLLLISPFIGLDALKRFLECAAAHHDFKVVVRWRPEDVQAGVSDISVYPYLTERGIRLYVNHDIHLKLYVFESNTAFSTSGNLTLRGFGYSKKPNVEVGNFVHLTQEDWSRIYGLIGASRQVDEDLFQRYKRYLESCPKRAEPAMAPPDLCGVPKAYTISALPAMETPAKLAQYYCAPDMVAPSAEETRRAAHDLATYSVPPNLSQSEFDQALGDSFRRTPFVAEFVELLKAEKSLRFGAVNEWIYGKCEDVPLPYRWEIKENTRTLYNWLEYFYPEITWDRPHYSQVIYWRAK